MSSRPGLGSTGDATSHHSSKGGGRDPKGFGEVRSAAIASPSSSTGYGTPCSEPETPNASGFFSVEKDPRFSSTMIGQRSRASFGSSRPSPRMMRSLPGLTAKIHQPLGTTATSIVEGADSAASTIRKAEFTGGNLHFSAAEETPRTGKIAGPASPQSPESARSSAQHQLDEWLKSFEHEKLAAPELAHYLHYKLHDALKRSELLGRPNEFETAVCCHLLDLVCRTFGRYSALVEQLKEEIFSAVYVDRHALLAALGESSGSATASTFFAFEPYFVRTKRLQEEKDALERDIETASRQRDKMQSELLKKKRVLNSTAFRWQRSVKQHAFGMWAKVVQLRRQQRAMLMQYFLNRDKSRLRLVMREWKLATDESRRNKAKMLLEESRAKVTEMEETRNRLDEERSDTEKSISDLKAKLEDARQEIARLDDATVRIQQQLAESKEEELRAAAEAWAELCDVAASSQLAALRSELIGYNTDSFGDVSLLVDHPTVFTATGTTVTLKTLPPFPTEEELLQISEQKSENQGQGQDVENKLPLDFTDPKAALQLPTDLIVLRWVNFHLRAAGYSKVVENFGSDLQDSEELAVVLSRCSRHSESPAVVSAKLRNVDIEARAQEIVSKCNKLGVPENMVTVEDIVLGNSDMLFALLSYLMCTAPMLQSDPSPWQIALDAIERAIPAWRQMCTDWGFDLSQADAGDKQSTKKRKKKKKKSKPAESGNKGKSSAQEDNAEEKGKLTGSSDENGRVTRAVDDERVAKVAKQVLAACSAAKAAIVRRNEAVRIWELLRERIRCAAWDTMLQRSKTGKCVEFIDRKQVREFKSFTRLRGFRYGGGGGSDTAKGSTSNMPLWQRLSMEDDPRKEIAAVTGVLESHFIDLKRIYRHYSCAEPGSAGTMDLNEMWMLAKDTKLLSESNLTLHTVQDLFVITSEAFSQKSKTAGSMPGKSHRSRVNSQATGKSASEMELMAPEYVEMLVRIADVKFQGIASAFSDGSGTAVTDRLTLSQCLAKLLDENIIPYACRSDADRFRRDLSSLQVKAVFRRHRDRLQSLFKHWCVPGEDHMDTSRWRSFARDRNFLSEAFTEAELFSVFNKIQDEEGALLASAGGLTLSSNPKKRKGKDFSTKGGEDESTANDGAAKQADRQEAVAIGQLNDEMTFSEFSEGLAAIAVYKDPDPYLPMHQKIESFLLNSVFGKLSTDKSSSSSSSSKAESKTKVTDAEIEISKEGKA